MGCEAQLAAQIFSTMTNKPSKLGQTDLVFVFLFNQGSSVRLCVLKYKSLITGL